MPGVLTSSSVLAKAGRADIIHEPFPHLIIHNALDSDLYEELARTYPSESYVIRSEQPANNKLYNVSASLTLPDERVSVLWREFIAYHTSQAFFHDILRLFEDEIQKLYPDLEALYGKPLSEFSTQVRQVGAMKNPANRHADMTMECQISMNSPVVKSTRVRGPHVDHIRKLYAGLLYFRQPADDNTGSNLLLYRYKDNKIPANFDYDLEDKYVEEVKEIRYEANTYVFWLNSIYAIHGVTPRDVTPLTRRFINMVGEVNTHPRGGLFTTRKQTPKWMRPFKSLFRKVEY